MLLEERNSSQRGGGKNDHEFRFLGNIELYERLLRINIFTIVRRGGGGQRVMIGIIIEENVYNYGRPLIGEGLTF